MKITLKNLKHSAFASEETPCYEGSIYIDGEREGTARNQGYGGPHEIQPFALEQRLNAYAATLPTRTLKIDDTRSFEHQPTAETLIDDALDLAFAERDFRRLLKTTLLFVRDGVLMETGKLPKGTIDIAIAKPDVAL